MNRNHIQQLFNEGIFPRGRENALLIETHANWIILAGEYAYKIKRPVKFSFLDYSTPSLRKHYCEEEVRLNRRLTDIYLGVEQVVDTGTELGIGLEGKAIDHAVVMRRLDPGRQMHTLLQKGLVTEKDVQKLAAKLANIHKYARVPHKGPSAESLLEDFADLSSVSEVLASQFGSDISENIELWIDQAGKVLDSLSSRISERHNAGFVIDGHGDLHSANIFLLEEPVVFDCVEFNEHFRINDVLSEMAFLAMDMERYGYKSLSKFMMREYQKIYPVILNEQDELLFLYFLLYRANVRLKIGGLKAMDTLEKQRELPDYDRKQLELFIRLCGRYSSLIERCT